MKNSLVEKTAIALEWVCSVQIARGMMFPEIKPSSAQLRKTSMDGEPGLDTGLSARRFNLLLATRLGLS